MPYGTAGSVRPDWIAEDQTAAFEAKNYNLTNGSSGLIRDASEQAVYRAKNLPAGMRQVLVIDARGQVVSATQENAIIKGITAGSNGALNSNSIIFKY